MSALALAPPEERFTAAEWAALVSDPTKDKAYQRRTTIGPHVADYLVWKENEDGAAPDTIRSYESKLALMCWNVPRHQPDTVTPDDLRAIRDMVPAGSRYQATAIFKDFWRWMYEESRVAVDPMSRIRYPKRDKPAITGLFSDEEKAAIVTAQTNLRDRACVLLLLRAGIRKGELRQLQVRDINLAEGYALVRRGKSRKARRVPLPLEVLNAVNVLLLEDVPKLDRQLEPTDYLLYPAATGNRFGPPDTTRSMGQGATHRWWYKCLERAGVVDTGVTSGRKMHTTRHTYATDLGRATNWNMVAVQKNLGHSSIAITIDLYTQFSYEDQAEAVALLPDITGEEG